MINSGNFDMLYMHISRSDLSSAALKPKYLEDKTQNIESREALNIPKHSNRVVSMYFTGSSPRFWIWLSFFECFGILSASLLSIFWVLSSKYFGFNAAEERSLLEICIYSISKFPLFIIRLVLII